MPPQKRKDDSILRGWSSSSLRRGQYLPRGLAPLKIFRFCRRNVRGKARCEKEGLPR